MEKNKKLIVLGVLALILIISGITYAILTWTSSRVNIGLTSNCFTIDYTKGNDIANASIKALNESDLISDNKFTIKEGIALTYANIGIKSTCTIEGYGSLYLNVTTLSSAFSTGNSKGALKYAVLDNTSTTSTVTVASLLNQKFNIVSKGSITSTGKITLLTKQLSNTKLNKYLIVIYADVSKIANDAMDASFNGTVSADANQGTAPVNAVELITDLYTNAPKTTTAVNNITYNLAPSKGLMNDRKGSMSTGIDAGNIRYYGANPNNYIYFNCSDYKNQSSSTCETWRIIGVFDGKVKLIRGSQIGTYSWDNKNTSTGAETAWGKNDWTDARLMKLLNPGYESETIGGSLYYNAKSGNCYSGQNNATKACYFTTTGLKNNTTRNMIAETTYYTRGHNTASIYVDAMYDKERVSGTVYSGRSTSWTGKVAIPYPSDYGYAADLSLCQKTLYDYNNATCTSNNWMKTIITVYEGWLLTPYSVSGSGAWHARSAGKVDFGNSAYDANGVAPVLSLISELDIGSGTGESNSPYQLSV